MESISQSGRSILSHNPCPVNPLLQLGSIWELGKHQSAANSCVFAYLWLASQASDVGSIPIARENNPRSFVSISFHVLFVAVGLA
jgi:hypothetical protein